MIRIALLAALCLLPRLASAEFRAAIGAWSYDLSGQVTDNGKTYDFERDLALHSTARASAQLQWFTGPRLPDVVASYSRFGATGHNERSVLVLLPPPPSTQTVTYDTNSSFRDLDVALRWPVRYGFALGLAVQQLNGDVVIDDSSNPPPKHEHYSVTFPQLHLAWRMPLASWLTLSSAGQGAALHGNRAVEWRAGAELTLFTHLVLEAGYQVKRYKIDVSGYRLDAHLRGALLRAGWAWG